MEFIGTASIPVIDKLLIHSFRNQLRTEKELNDG